MPDALQQMMDSGMVLPARLGKVAVLMGGPSAERPVSLMSGEGVLKALVSKGVDAHAFDPAQRPLSDLKANGFDRCFIALHGRHGEDGTVQGALELMGIPYTGSGVMASALAMDKVTTKRVWLSEKLPTPRWMRLGQGQHDAVHAAKAVEALGLPIIVKPAREGSSFGVSKVTDASQMLAAVQSAASFDPDVLCEECIEGDEVTCAVLGEGDTAVALPVIRIQAPEGNYDFEHKYISNDTRYLCPSELPAELEATIRRLSVEAYRLLECRGWGRADLMIRRTDGQPFLLEMNTSPGMTSHSLVPMAARVAGLSYEALCIGLLATTLENAQP